MAYRVTAQYVHGDGSPRSGRIRFAPSTTVVGEERIILPAPLSVELDAHGALAVDLVGTDDPDYSPAGWVWTVTESVHSGRPPYSMELTGDVDLSEVSPVVPPDDYVTLVPVARTITAGAGLTGGGTLAADRTLSVGAGVGIVVAADTVSVDTDVVATVGALADEVTDRESADSALAQSLSDEADARVAGDGAASDALAAHAGDTTGVHGIADTAALVSAGDDVTVLGSGSTPAGHVSTADGSGGVEWAPPAGGAVDSVNGQTGDVVLDAADVGAAPESHSHLATGISDSTSVGRAVLTAADAASARAAIGAGTSSFSGAYGDLAGAPDLGGAAGLDVGTAVGTVAAGDDARLSDDRDPTAHAASHGAAGSDPVTLAQSQVTGLSDVLGDLADAAVPTGGTEGQVLAKASATDLDTEWIDQTGGGAATSRDLADVSDSIATAGQVLVWTPGVESWVGNPVDATASQENLGTVAESVWDNNASTYWNSGATNPAWTVADYGAPVYAAAIYMLSNSTITTWTLAGSNDGTSWTTVASGLSISISAPVRHTFTRQAWRYWRMTAAENWQDPKSFTLVDAVDLWVPVDPSSTGLIPKSQLKALTAAASDFAAFKAAIAAL